MVRLSVLLVASVLVTGCASTGAVPRPFPLPAGAQPPATAGEGSAAAVMAPTDGYSISSTALSLRGAPYRYGGADPAGFDCSGFVSYVFAQHGLRMPREVRQQYEVGKDVTSSALAPGDLVFFSTVTSGASHVGIIIGGDQFVHAPSTNGVVRVEHLGTRYWADRFLGAKRVN